MESDFALVDPLEADNRFNTVTKPRRRKCDCRNYCTINDKNGRPSCLFLLVLAGIFFCLALIPSGLGFISLYDVSHEVETNMTIIGYAIDKVLCNNDESDGNIKPWRITIIGTFIAHSRMITDQTYYVCGWYEDDAWDLAQKQYPKYSQMTIWYWDDNPKYIKRNNPSNSLITIYFGLGSFLICFLILIINSVLVMCCGFDSVCISEYLLCRCRDPYKKQSERDYH